MALTNGVGTVEITSSNLMQDAICTHALDASVLRHDDPRQV